MFDLQWYDYVRLATIVLAIWTAWKMSSNIRKRTAEVHYSTQLKDFIWVIYACHVLVVEACVEGIESDIGYAWRIPVQLMVELVILRAVLKPLDPLEIEKENYE